MSRLKLKPRVKTLLYKIVIGIIICFIAVFSIKSIINMTKQSLLIENKLDKVGYNEKEIKLFKECLSDKELDKLSKEKKDKYLYGLLSEKYFIKSNLKKYEAYLKENPNTNYSLVISLVNTRSSEKAYTNPVNTDMSKENLILVNKYNKLADDYVPNLVLMSDWYAYGTNYMTEEAYQAFIKMFNGAKNQGFTIVATSCYRSFEDQKRIYDRDLLNEGEEYTDTYVARPAYSEHQTGLAVDLLQIGYNLENFEESEAYNWLKDYAHYYGFILRYPKDKENITGYSFESWHYRYVGIDVATKMYNEGITYDEYYAYYIAK